jgi:hypothetical protein
MKQLERLSVNVYLRILLLASATALASVRMHTVLIRVDLAWLQVQLLWLLVPRTVAFGPDTTLRAGIVVQDTIAFHNVGSLFGM